MTPTAAAIIPAGGAGLRMGHHLPKQFCELAGIPVLAHTLRTFQQVDAIDSIILVVPADHVQRAREMAARFGLDRVHAIVAGGERRQDSVKIGLDMVAADTEYVVVHDGARPLVSPSLIAACLEQARRSGAAMAAVPVNDTIKAVNPDNIVGGTVDRTGLWQAQTPQAARTALLREAFAAAEKDDFAGTDEASLLEHIDLPVTVVEGSERNIKITRPEDLMIAEALLMKDKRQQATACLLRTGHGYDAHQLVPDRPLVLGGVTIPHSLGLLGHSDADVLTHALCDALLGAMGEGDIGRHFPDSEPQYAGISSLELLKQIISLAEKKGYTLINADVTVVAQKPKLAPYFMRMRDTLAKVCRIASEAVNIKASTTEGLGFTGREEGIAAHAVVLMQKRAE